MNVSLHKRARASFAPRRWTELALALGAMLFAVTLLAVHVAAGAVGAERGRAPSLPADGRGGDAAEAARDHTPAADRPVDEPSRVVRLHPAGIEPSRGSRERSGSRVGLPLPIAPTPRELARRPRVTSAGAAWPNVAGRADSATRVRSLLMVFLI